MFFLTIFSWSAMNGHYKHEELVIFNMNKKNQTARFLFLKTGHQLANNLRFLAK